MGQFSTSKTRHCLCTNVGGHAFWTMRTTNKRPTEKIKMCDDCFKTEIKSFSDQTTWNSFDLELTKKLGEGKMKNVKFVNDGQRDKDDGQYIYECLTCGEKWKMKDPDNAFRGYFLKLSTVDKVAMNLTLGQKIGLGFVGLIILRVIYGLLTN